MALLKAICGGGPSDTIRDAGNQAGLGYRIAQGGM